jgi:hypothetical protein
MVAQEGGEVRWVLPGVRKLDPAIFGTPGAPLRTDLVPESERAVDGGLFTTEGPTPFSDNSAAIEGRAEVKVEDVTSVSGATTRDEIDAEFEFTSPDGEINYTVIVKDALPEIPDHENFGGVGVNALQHGATGIGTPLMPQVMAFIAFWGKADLYIDGVLQNGDKGQRFAHFMLSERVRTSVDDGYELAFDADVDHEGSLQAHLILPPVAVTPDGPMDDPVSTGFTLPNDAEQPFLHIMYDTVRVSPDFEDVPADSVHAQAIDRIIQYGITVGTSETTFNPSGDLSRAQMSTFLVRLLILTDSSIEQPADHEAAMTLLVEKGLLLGDANGNLGGAGTLTRGQAASLLARLLEDATGAALAPSDLEFSDVAVTNAHAENIAKLVGSGVIHGYGDNTFRSGTELRRDQMASLISRTIDVLIASGDVRDLAA